MRIPFKRCAQCSGARVGQRRSSAKPVGDFGPDNGARTVALTVSGERDSRPAELSHVSVVESGEEHLEFSFKYFQRIEGLLSLPPGFVPRRVFVKVDAMRERPSRTEQSFEWPEEAG